MPKFSSGQIVFMVFCGCLATSSIVDRFLDYRLGVLREQYRGQKDRDFYQMLQSNLIDRDLSWEKFCDTWKDFKEESGETFVTPSVDAKCD